MRHRQRSHTWSDADLNALGDVAEIVMSEILVVQTT